MTVYVDELHLYGKYKWCHMWCDGDVEELHTLAEKIGMKRSWFQNNLDHLHYDLRASKRMLAIENGAVQCTSKDLIRMIREKRNTNV